MLTIQQTDFIMARVEREQIHLSHLAAELIDHICCDVESEMDRGASFDEAYDRVETRIGNRGLKKIQEDTLYLIDKNYRIMKNTMKTTGIIGPALLGLGALFKIMHWPGAGIILVLGFFVLCFIFLPSATSVLYKESKERYSKFLFISGFISAFLFSLGILWKIQHWPGAGIMLLIGDSVGILLFLPVFMISKVKKSVNKKKMSAYIMGFIALILYIAGSLFKLMHWPGAAILLLVGAILLFGIAIPLYTYHTFRETEFVTGRFIFIILASVWIIINTSLLTLKVSSRVFDRYDMIYADLMQHNKELIANNEMMRNQLTDSLDINEISVISKMSSELLDEIGSIRNDMINLANKNEATDPTESPFTYISNIDDRKIPFNLMIGQDSSGRAFELKRDLLNYVLEVDSRVNAVGNMKITSDLSGELSDKDWEYKSFANTLGYTFNYLALLEQKVLLIESESYISVR